MKKIISERTLRIKQTFPDIHNVKDLRGEIALSKNIIKNLQLRSKLVVYDCLTSFYKNDFFDAEIPVEQFFKKYANKA